MGSAVVIDMARCYGSLTSKGSDQAEEDVKTAASALKSPAKIFRDWKEHVSGTDSGRGAARYIESGAQALGLPEDKQFIVQAGYALYDIWLKSGGFSAITSITRRELQDVYNQMSSDMTHECRYAFKDIDSIFTTGKLAARDDTSNSNEDSSPTASSTLQKIKCDTWSQNTMGFQLCSGISVTNSSTALISGSITNTGTATLCGLTLLIGNFDQALSFYPSWLPSLQTSFKPGDVITFGATVPLNPSEPVPSVDVDSTLIDCSPINEPPSAPVSPTNTTDPASTTNSPTTTDFDGPTTTTEEIGPDPKVITVPDTPADANVGDDSSSSSGGSSYVSSTGIDWGYFAGDTRCLGKCMQAIDDLEVCDAVNMIFNANCGSDCGDSALMAVQMKCLQYDCTTAQCHYNPQGAATTSGGHSVKSSLSVLLGFLSLALVLQIR